MVCHLWPTLWSPRLELSFSVVVSCNDGESVVVLLDEHSRWTEIVFSWWPPSLGGIMSPSRQWPHLTCRFLSFSWRSIFLGARALSWCLHRTFTRMHTSVTTWEIVRLSHHGCQTNKAKLMKLVCTQWAIWWSQNVRPWPCTYWSIHIDVINMTIFEAKKARVNHNALSWFHASHVSLKISLTFSNVFTLVVTLLRAGRNVQFRGLDLWSQGLNK